MKKLFMSVLALITATLIFTLSEENTEVNVSKDDLKSIEQLADVS